MKNKNILEGIHDENLIYSELQKDENIILNNSQEQDEELALFNEYLKKEKKQFTIIKAFILLSKYIVTTSFIFLILLASTNYEAYLSIAKNHFQKDEMQKVNNSIINSVKAVDITNENKRNQEKSEKAKVIEKKEKKKKEAIFSNVEIENTEKNLSSFMRLKYEKPSLNINITPYENRIIIPKIGKNIPLVDIKNRMVSGQSELESIFMKELEKGVVRYPGSVKPGKIGNSFIFGHSSNFPWMKGDYNEVFALLGNLENGDEIIIYYEQKKYIYKVKKKDVISPTNTKVLKGNDSEAKLLIMTCRPVGTTINRLIVTGELVKE